MTGSSDLKGKQSETVGKTALSADFGPFLAVMEPKLAISPPEKHQYATLLLHRGNIDV